MGPIIDSDSANLAAFKKRGGKLIQYHGWNDPAIPARSSVVYYEELGRTMGDTSGFYRLYLIPGMLHCGGGNGPSTVDWISVLDSWVVGGKAPGELTATTPVGGASGPSQSSLKQNKMMMGRVTMQAGAILIVALLLLMNGGK